MLRDPNLFVQFAELAFKPASAGPDEQPTLTAAQQQLALSAMDVLHDWPDSQFAPSVDDEGKLDAASLNDWINATRERLAAVDRTDIGDQMIGQALASSPADPDGSGLARPSAISWNDCKVTTLIRAYTSPFGTGVASRAAHLPLAATKNVN